MSSSSLSLLLTGSGGRRCCHRFSWRVPGKVPGAANTTRPFGPGSRFLLKYWELLSFFPAVWSLDIGAGTSVMGGGLVPCPQLCHSGANLSLGRGLCCCASQTKDIYESAKTPIGSSRNLFSLSCLLTLLLLLLLLFFPRRQSSLAVPDPWDSFLQPLC